MNNVKKIGKNTVLLMLSSINISVLSFVLSIFVARILGDVAFGKFTFANALPALLTVFLDLGYATFFIRDVSRDKSLSYKYLNNILSFRLFLFPIIFILMAIFINAMGYPEDTKNIVYLFGIFIFLRTLSNIFFVVFRTYEKMEYEASILIFTNILRTSFALLVLFLGYGLIELGLTCIIFTIPEFIIGLIVCRKKFVKVKFQLPFSFIRSTIKIALPLGIISILGIILVRLDTVMLSLFKGDAEVGWYNAAYNLVLGFQFIPQLFMYTLLPSMSFYYISARESLQITYEKSFKYLFILGLPISVGICLLADKFIIVFYGNDFTNSIIALQILSWDILLFFICSCAGFVLISIDKQNQMAATIAFSTILNFSLNLFLIPVLSYVGAGIATIMSQIVVLIIYLFLNKQNSLIIKIREILLPPIIACSIMGLFLYTCKEIHFFLLIFFAILIYFLFLILLKGFNKNDFVLFKQLIKKH